MLQSDNMTSSTPVLLPQLGLEVTEGTVNVVLVEVGAEVTRDQPLIELETDKAVTDVVAPTDGTVVSIEVAPGDVVPVGAVLMQLATSAPAESAGNDAAEAAPAAAAGGRPFGSRRVARPAAATAAPFGRRLLGRPCGPRRGPLAAAPRRARRAAGGGQARDRPCGPLRDRSSRADHAV